MLRRAMGKKSRKRWTSTGRPSPKARQRLRPALAVQLFDTDDRFTEWHNKSHTAAYAVVTYHGLAEAHCCSAFMAAIFEQTTQTPLKISTKTR